MKAKGPSGILFASVVVFLLLSRWLLKGKFLEIRYLSDYFVADVHQFLAGFPRKAEDSEEYSHPMRTTTARAIVSEQNAEQNAST